MRLSHPQGSEDLPELREAGQTARVPSDFDRHHPGAGACRGGRPQHRTVRNLAAQRRLSPAEYYRTVEKENCEGLFRTLSLLEKAVGGAAGTHRAATLDLQLGDTARQLLQAVSRTVRLDWIRGLSLKAETNTADGRLGVNAAVTLNGTPLVSVDALADTGTGTLTVSIPELSENTLSLSAEDLGIGLSDLEKLLQGRSDRGEDSALLQKYVELAAGQVRDVEIGRADLEAEGVSRTYTTLTVKLNGEELRAATLAVCEELSGDELILSRLRAASARAESTFVNALQTLC